MLTVVLLMAASALALCKKNWGRWLALLSFLGITRSFSLQWLPGVVFSWRPAHPLLTVAFSMVVLAAVAYARRMDRTGTSMVLLFSAGLMGFIGSSNPFQLFFFLELMLFPAFYLLLREDPSAAFKYFGFMQVSSVLVLAGLLGSGPVASALLTLGFAIKMGVFPFHSWVPDSHSQAPAPLGALLGGCLVACGGYGILRFSSTPGLLLPAGLLSAAYGAMGASSADNIERLLAYSTISQMGLAAAALSLAPRAVVAFLAAHALAKSALIFSAAEMVAGTGVRRVNDMRVASRTLLPAVFLSALSMAGFPPLLGFLAEFTLVSGSLASSPLAAGLLLFALLPTALYCHRLVSVFFHNARRRVESTLPLALALVLLLLGVMPWTPY